MHWKNVPAASSILALRQGEVRRTFGLSVLSKSEENDYTDQSVAYSDLRNPHEVES